jgi:hypothetical protein
MSELSALRRERRRDPGEIDGALLFFSLIAAAGFAVGWMTHALGAV